RNRKFFGCSAGPLNFNLLNFRTRTESEVNARIGARTIASSAVHIAALPYATSSDEGLGADPVSRTLRAPHQLECNPVIVVLHHIAKQGGSRVHIVDYDIDVPVIEQVSKSSTAGCNYVSEPASGCWWNLLKHSSIAVTEELRPLCIADAPILLIHPRIDMSISYKNIQKTIVIKIQESRSPRQKGNGWVS